jgi:peptidoglycan/LPS O-acetylase OafA/YrhL
MSSASGKIAYRPDIDGLRAIAVLGVVFFHAGLRFPGGLRFQGGYVGVDVFFVISGFLITSLLLKDLRQGTFSLLNFWERRARRILPAMAVVVAAILVAGWFFLMPADYEVLSKQVIALLGFSSNIKLWLECGYFSAVSETKPLLHTWSLSLEEQFYLLIPLLLAFLFWIRKSYRIVPMLLIITLVSFGLAVYGSYYVPDATFFLLPTRAWELGLGSLLACARPIPQARLRTVAAWLGLAAILVPFFCYVPGIRFPGLTALPPVAGAALLIWSGFAQPTADCQLPIPNRLLTLRPLVWVGLLSYSLYLWHWPLFAFQKYISYVPPSRSVRLSLVGASILLAWLSLRFVERPFRSRAFIRSRNHIFALSAGVVAILMLASVMLWKTKGARNRLSPEDQRIADSTTDYAFRNGLTAKDIPDHLVQFGAPGLTPKVLVWGDSHAMSMMPAIDLACKEANIAARGATAHATAPVLEWFKLTKHGLSDKAPEFNAAVLDYIKIAAPKGLTHVILAAHWEWYLADQTETERFKSALRRTVQEIQATGCRVFILIDVPQFPFNPPRAFVINALLGRSSSALVIDSAQYMTDTALQRPFLSALSQHGVVVIDPADFFIDANGIISPFDHMGALYFDKDHLTTHGSQRFKPTFKSILQSGS